MSSLDPHPGRWRAPAPSLEVIRTHPSGKRDNHALLALARAGLPCTEVAHPVGLPVSFVRNLVLGSLTAAWVVFLDQHARPDEEWVEALHDDVQRVDADATVLATVGRPNGAGTPDVAYRRDRLAGLGSFRGDGTGTFTVDDDLQLTGLAAGLVVAAGRRRLRS